MLHDFPSFVIRTGESARIVHAKWSGKWRDTACGASPLNCPTTARSTGPPCRVSEQQPFSNAERRSGAGHRK